MKNGAAKTTNGKCLNPDHRSRKAKFRGLCNACYQAASRLIRANETTWEELEAQGKALHVKRGRPNTSATWFDKEAA